MTKRKKHTGFWVDVDGEPVHMLADPNMSQETMDALAAMVRAVRNMPVDEDNLQMCARCGQRKTAAPDGICGYCKRQEILGDID